jgi:hypothetical protein
MEDSLAKARLARSKALSQSNSPTERFQNQLEALTPTRRASVGKRLAEMPELFRGAYMQAVDGNSPTTAIKAFCLECVGWQRPEVAACTSLACPLYAYRRYQ